MAFGATSGFYCACVCCFEVWCLCVLWCAFLLRFRCLLWCDFAVLEPVVLGAVSCCGVFCEACLASVAAGSPIKTSVARVFFTCFSPQPKFPCQKKGTPIERKVESTDRAVCCAAA